MKKIIINEKEIIKEIIILNKYNEKLVGILEEKQKNNSLIILCHGFYGNKNQFLFTSLSKKLIQKKFSVFRFDFSGNGESQGIFGKSGIKKEVDDLKSVIKHFNGYKNIILIGHSMGGAVSLMLNNYSKRIKKLILINPLVFPTISFKDSILKYTPGKLLNNIYSKKEKNIHNNNNNNNLLNLFKKKINFLFKKNGLYTVFMKELNVDTIAYAKKINIPTLIIHSKNDEIIPLSHVDYLFNHIKYKKKELIILNYHHMSISDLNKKSIKEINNIIFKWLKK